MSPSLPSFYPLGRFLPTAGKLMGMVILTLCLFGCAGSENYTVDYGQLADWYLPTTRDLEHHPDSLGSITLTSEDDHLKYEFEDDYHSLWQKWSCTYNNIGVGRSRQQPLSFATFWGLELSLASLQAEGGLTLTEDKARELIENRRTETQSTIQIDVFWFTSEGSTTLAGPGSQVKLRVGDDTYRPEKEEHSPLREAFLDAGATDLYRRNTFHFTRVVDGEDILKGENAIELQVRHIDAVSDRIQFQWTWGSEQV